MKHGRCWIILSFFVQVDSRLIYASFSKGQSFRAIRSLDLALLAPSFSRENSFFVETPFPRFGLDDLEAENGLENGLDLSMHIVATYLRCSQQSKIYCPPFRSGSFEFLPRVVDKACSAFCAELNIAISVAHALVRAIQGSVCGSCWRSSRSRTIFVSRIAFLIQKSVFSSRISGLGKHLFHGGKTSAVL